MIGTELLQEWRRRKSEVQQGAQAKEESELDEIERLIIDSEQPSMELYNLVFEGKVPDEKVVAEKAASIRRAMAGTIVLHPGSSLCVNQLGGVEPIADMLNLMDKNSEKNIMGRVEEKDPELAEEIRKLMFVFEDLVYVDDRGIQALLKEVDQQKLVIALKTAPEEIKAKLFKNMSNRAATLLNEDLDALGPTKLSDVEKAQAEIVQKCKELESQGKAFISRGGEGDALV